jgi:hypothetical protein
MINCGHASLTLVSSVAALLMTTFTGCKKLTAASDGPDAMSSAPSSSVVATASAPSSTALTTASAPAKKAPVTVAPASVECRAKNEGGLIELSLTWDRNTAKGTLTSDGKSRPVIAELYKGLVLVDAPGASPVTGNVATVTTEGKKTIRVGDYKQPTFDCN